MLLSSYVTRCSHTHTHTHTHANHRQILVVFRHSAIHSGKSTFQCRICSASFAQRATLTRRKDCLHLSLLQSHARCLPDMRIHAKEKSFQCSICEKAFECVNTLSEHLKGHMRRKPSHAQSIATNKCESVSAPSTHSKKKRLLGENETPKRNQGNKDHKRVVKEAVVAEVSEQKVKSVDNDHHQEPKKSCLERVAPTAVDADDSLHFSALDSFEFPPRVPSSPAQKGVGLQPFNYIARPITPSPIRVVVADA